MPPQANEKKVERDNWDGKNLKKKEKKNLSTTLLSLQFSADRQRFSTSAVGKSTTIQSNLFQPIRSAAAPPIIQSTALN